ncbi:hypothetical protein Tco_1064802 [Tanacetum coccineum]
MLGVLLTPFVQNVSYDKLKQAKESVVSLGWLLEETHVTWAHLEKKRTRLQLYTKSDEENSYIVAGDGVTVFREGVRISRRCQDFLGRRQDCNATTSGFWRHRRDEPT